MDKITAKLIGGIDTFDELILPECKDTVFLSSTPQYIVLKDQVIRNNGLCIIGQL